MIALITHRRKKDSSKWADNIRENSQRQNVMTTWSSYPADVYFRNKEENQERDKPLLR